MDLYGDDAEFVVGGLEDGAVMVRKSPDGRAMLVPVSLRRLAPEQLELLGDVQDYVLDAQRARAGIAESVTAARDAGVSWVAIAWYLGVTPQAAAKRFGGPDGSQA